MKIKITKAHETKWYHNRIGKIYIVKMIHEFAGTKAYVIRNYRTVLRSVDINDAEIIEK